MNGQAKVGLQINMEGDVVARLNDLTKRVDEVAGHASKLDKVFKGFSVVKFDAIANSVSNLRNNINAMVAPGVEFEQSVLDLKAITGIADKRLEDFARNMGVQSALGAQGVVDAFKMLASNIDVNIAAEKSGTTAKNVLEGLTSEVIKLSQAAGMQMQEASNAVAFTLNQWGLSFDKAGLVVDALAAGSKYGAAEVTDLSLSLKNAGATAAAAGLSVYDAVGALEVLSQNSLKGAEAGTGLRNVISMLQTKGIEGVDLATDGLNTTLAKLKDKINDATWVTETFGRENANTARILVSNADAVSEMVERVKESGVAAEQAAIRTSSYAFKLKQTQERLNDFKISVFNASGGLVVWAEAAFSVLVPISQTLPLLSALSQGFKALNVVQKVTAFWNGVCGGSFTGLAAAIWTATRAFWASPWGKAIAIITGVVAVVSALAMKFDYVREKVDGVTNAVKNLLGLGKKIDVDAGVTMSTNVNDLSTRDKSDISNQTLTDQFSEQNNTASGGGSSMVRNNNISIGNLIGQFTIKVDSVKNGGQNIKEQISRALIDAVRDTELALG
jgi:TP901 family phage tail tape measure protein